MVFVNLFFITIHSIAIILMLFKKKYIDLILINLMMLFFSIFNFCFIRPEYYFSSIFSIYICLFNFGGFLRGSKTKKKEFKYGTKYSSFYSTLTIVFQLLTLLILIKHADVSIFDFKSMITLPHKFAYLRYIRKESIPIVVRLLNIFTYTGVYISTIDFFNKEKLNVKSFIPSILLIVQGIIIGTKSLVILVFIFYITAILIKSKIGKGNGLKIFGYVVNMVLSAFSISIILQLMRSRWNQSIFSVVIKLITSYFVVPSGAFIKWLYLEYDEVVLSKLASLFFLNKSYSIASRFEVPIDVDYLFGTFSTNVYTGYRFMVANFGMIGVLFILIVIGYIYRMASNKMLEGQYRAIAIYFIITVNMFFSFAGNLFQQTTIALSFILLYVIFLLEDLLFLDEKSTLLKEKR